MTSVVFIVSQHLHRQSKTSQQALQRHFRVPQRKTMKTVILTYYYDGWFLTICRLDVPTPKRHQSEPEKLQRWKKQTQDKLDIYSWLLSAGFPSLWTHICLGSICLFATKGGTSDTSGAFQLAARLGSAVFFSFCIFYHFYVVYYSCKKSNRKHNNNC